uniref:Isopenicillin N synthase-like Fe(2+) 2OG dioxygenase domain-containing protein n=2 Tax=Physcomitrium patens TaxID=3218 RepID=A0A7I4A1E9_PHYPA
MVPGSTYETCFRDQLGDKTQIMTNGRYKSVLHRAVANRAAMRYSIANFLVPADETVIRPIAELVSRSSSSPAMCCPVSYGEYTGRNSYLFRPLEGKRRIDSFLVSAS